MAVVADRKYGVYHNYRWLRGAGIRAHIKPFEPGDRPREFGRELFTYDEAADVMWCPAGQRLKRSGWSSHRAGAPTLQYQGNATLCGACPSKARCCPDAKSRTVSRAADDGLYMQVRADAKQPEARYWQSRRMVWVEPVMAELKERHGLRRASLRGNGVQIQAYFAGMAYNIKKLVKAAGRPTGSAASSGADRIQSALSLSPAHSLTRPHAHA